MNGTHTPPPVVAGIDGSETAIRAAQWAIDEAISRSATLRLVYVTKATHPSAEEYQADVSHGKASLRTAQTAIEAVERPVKVETAIVAGPPGAAFVEESVDAGLICVGSAGISRYATAILGSTATELAEKSHCPVAIIRPPDDKGTPRDIRWIVVAVNDEPDNSAVVKQAMDEAKLRNAPVLAVGERDTLRGTHEGLDSEVPKWRQCYPDVHIYPVADQSDVASFLKNHDDRVELAVIGGSEADQLARIIGPFGHPLLHHSECSVLVVRA